MDVSPVGLGLYSLEICLMEADKKSQILQDQVEIYFCLNSLL